MQPFGKARKAIVKRLEERHGLLAAVSGAYALPVLTQAMRIDAEALFPQAVINRAVQNGLVKKEAFKLTVGQLAEAGAVRGLFARVVSIVISAAVVIAGITTIFRLNNTEIPVDDPYTISASAGALEEGPQPSSGALAGGEWEMYEGEVAGLVLFKNHAGHPISDVGFTPLGFLVELQDGAGNVVAQATAGEDGGFLFGNVRLPMDDECVVIVSSPEMHLVTQTTEKDGEGMVFTPRQLQGAEPLQVYVSLAQAPFGTVVPHGGTSAYGYMNPQSLEYVPDFARIEQAVWEITPENSTDVLYSGSGTLVREELALLQRGEYTVRFSVVDVFGNSEEVRYDFVIA